MRSNIINCDKVPNINLKKHSVVLKLIKKGIDIEIYLLRPSIIHIIPN